MLKNQKKVEVLIEPVIETKFPRKVGRTEMPSPALVPLKYRFKITFLGDVIPSQMTLSNISLRSGDQDIYYRTYAPISVENPRSESTVLTEPLIVVFPLSGIYWLNAKVDAGSDYTVETKQRTLEGEIGHGWPSDQPDNRSLWRGPVTATDFLALVQTRLAVSMTILSWVMLIATMIQLGIALAPILSRYL
ncbi:MAG: hypothetical protein AB1631_28530 [Acidobacteriota bacterium]